MGEDEGNMSEELTVTIRNINSARHPIPDVPVLYLVEPTATNLNLINADLSRNLYADAYINFTSSIPRPLMEDFAAQIAEAGTSESVAQVYDQYLNFIVAEPDLFTLGLGKETYGTLNSAQTKDEDLDTLIDKIVSGLFSVAVTMGMSFDERHGRLQLTGAQARYRSFAAREVALRSPLLQSLIAN